MRVNIDEIKDGGLDRAWAFSRDQLDGMLEGDPAGYRARAPAQVAAHLDKLGRRVLLRARSQAVLDAPCARCLSPAAVEVPVDFALTLVPEEEARRPDEKPAEDGPRARPGGSFTSPDADEEIYAGKQIDLDPILREQLLLALPSYPLCREGCRGLCPACGQNLNERECGCERHVPDPRWAGLEKFRAGTK
jgi:uncharacterized protein